MMLSPSRADWEDRDPRRSSLFCRLPCKPHIRRELITFGDGRLQENAHIPRSSVWLELVLTQITELERERDAVVETEASDKASKMIQQLTGLRGIGVGACVLPVGLPSEPCRGEAGRAD